MNRYRTIALAGLAVFALSACKREAEAPPPVETATAPTEEIKSAVISEVDHNSPASASPTFDVKAFAGTYNGTIPCADCPGIDASIAFSPEGKYTQTLRYQERENSSVSEGNWTLDADGKRILLDPTSKEESDSWVEVVSPTEVRMLDGEGKPIDSGLNYSLKRS
ncbi:copper resistance protein NlpE [Thermomonas sp. HDW16]|uniref:copper resistance protein NlpE n=1 Tax=Thermomonas sp. HDW16 TaxID=2714945 RepID=UPI001409B3DB|nr:copper resistance protein NlpE [Thermomonas sp. HDW16]QIL20431.1 copper resistance protein NlpE [Thermomonas sp. HDW16]